VRPSAGCPGPGAAGEGGFGEERGAVAPRLAPLAFLRELHQPRGCGAAAGSPPPFPVGSSALKASRLETRPVPPRIGGFPACGADAVKPPRFYTLPVKTLLPSLAAQGKFMLVDSAPRSNIWELLSRRIKPILARLVLPCVNHWLLTNPVQTSPRGCSHP